MIRVACLALALVAVGCRRSDASRASPAASAAPSASASASSAPPTGRCDLAPAGAWITLGREVSPGGDEDLLPFAVQVGSATAHAGGFAVGALMPPAGGPATAAVITVDADTRTSKTTSLGAAHGDTEPPRVVSSPRGLFAALLESSGSRRSLRVALVEGDKVTWGPEFEQGRDESMAFDLAVAAPRSVAVWDDDARAPERGIIRLATFTTADLGAPTAPRAVTNEKTDAESPRVVPRAGGFWLSYIARRPEPTDDDARYAGEESSYRWLEVVPLDQNAAPTAPARRVTAEKGHALAFDAAPLDADSLVIVYRDDDTPSGAAGGAVLRVVVRPDGSTDPETITAAQVGVGAPALLAGGWLAVADAAGDTRLGRVGAGGVVDRLVAEPAIGVGMPLAALGDRLLVARPRGTSVRLVAVECARPLPPDAALAR
ncbi:MAG: hypothetical protein IT374_20440 [Polyangiaceae bacterium]|nr:hypothetical protein [Polyangiaceae bacterium]